jgi:hypothetical protein
MVPVAAMQTTKDNSPLEAARAAGLGLAVNQTQTIGGVSVTLDYVYADVREIAIFATVESTRGQVDISHRWTSRLKTPGHEAFFRHGEGGRLAEDVALTPIIKHFEFTPEFDASELEALPDELEMTFIMSTLKDPVRAPEATADASPESTQEAKPLPDFTYEFQFTVPFYRAIEKQLDDTQTVNDTPLTLKSVSITPISTDLELCMDFPHDNTWRLRGSSLKMEGNVTMINRLTPYFFRDDCEIYSVMAYAGLQPQQLEFQIEAIGQDLIFETEIDWEALVPQLEENGISMTLNEAGMPQGLDTIPPGGELNYIEVLNELGVGERIEGPWTFEVDLQ